MRPTYTDESSNPKRNAQRNLWGKTHYCDDDTLRYFRSRILSAFNIGDDHFAIIEACSGDYENKTRIKRGVIFDATGQVIYRPGIEESFKTSEKARKALWAFVNEKRIK